jgi:hypothetical protein
MTEITEEELLARLRTLATSDEQRVPSAAVRTHVMRAWDERRNARQSKWLTRPRISFRVWVPVAASLAIVLGLMIGSMYERPLSGGLPEATSARIGPDDLAQSMLSLPDASALPRFDHGELIRVEIPSPAGAIQAEVLVGQDGLARAIRVIR